jgi:hypothetical protein
MTVGPGAGPPDAWGERPPLPGTGEEAGDGLLIREIPLGTALWRIHHSTRPELHFGDSSVDFRFNDPGAGARHPRAPAPYAGSRRDRGTYGVCYLGLTPAAAFAETFLRRPARRDLARSEIDTRRLTPVRTTREMRLVQLDGAGLARAHVEAAVVNGGDYVLSRTVSRLLWRRGDAPDGIVYAARHDNHLYAAAVFDRARTAFTVGVAKPIGDDLLRDMIGRYRFNLV